MNVTAKINQTFNNEKRLKAFVTVFIDKAFVVTGVRILDCEKGLTVFMPSRQDNKGVYKDICFPITAELRSEINTAALNAYDKHLKYNVDNKQ